jgi:hypothetical protein
MDPHDALNILLNHSESIDVSLMCRLTMISKDMNKYVYNNWKKATFTKEIHDICKFCDTESRVGCEIPFLHCQPELASRVVGAKVISHPSLTETECKVNIETPFNTCKHCLKNVSLITATDAKKIWFLNDEDLEDLNVLEKWNSRYRQHMRLFDKEEVKLKSLERNGPPKNLYDKQNKPKPLISAAKAKRIASIATKYPDIPDDMKQACMDDYINNGKGGLSTVKERVERWKEFDAYMSTLALEEKDLFLPHEIKNHQNEHTINGEHGNVPQMMTVILNIKKKTNDRRKMLIAKLNERNLELRSDSKICRDYIEGYRNDIDNVVNIMDEMAYYYNCTDYPAVMNRLVESFKERLRHTEGWLPEDEYQDILEDEIPRLSARAKKMARRINRK